MGRLPDGRVVFVPRTAPGDRVRVRITRDRTRWSRGQVVELLEAGEGRRDAPCPLYDRCGGCQLQHLRYRDQVAWKGRRIASALSRIGGVEMEGSARGRRSAPAGEEAAASSVDPVPVEPSPSEWRYRNRVSFTLRRLRGGRVVAGFHRRDRPGWIVDVHRQCLLPEDPISTVWIELRRAWGAGARRLPPGGELRLTLRSGGDGVGLVIEGGEAGGDAPALVGDVPGLVSVVHRPRQGGWRHLAGVETVADLWLGEPIPLAGTTFLQVNREAGEALHRSVLGELGNPAGLRIVDAYCGVGAYGRRLAHHGARVVGLELDPLAVEAARRGAPPGFQVREGRVEECLEAALPADRVILNPPRTGLHEAVPQLLTAHPVPRILYISCDPGTLARDLDRLGSAYRVRRVAGFDLFPQTAHVESVVTLDHARAGPTLPGDVVGSEIDPPELDFPA